MVDLKDLEEIVDLEDHEEALGRLHDGIKAAFGLDLAPGDLALGSTYGDVFERVKAKLGGLGSPACLTSIAFYRLRGELARASGQDNKQIRPDTLMADLFSWRKRRAAWRQLEVATGLRLPRLVAGPWVNAVHVFGPILPSLSCNAPVRRGGVRGGLDRFHRLRAPSPQGGAGEAVERRRLHESGRRTQPCKALPRGRWHYRGAASPGVC